MAAIEVSVIVPARDAAATLEDQLDALAGQTFDGRWEVVLVDDGSTDATAEIAVRWAERIPSLTVLSSVVPGGPSQARNIGTRVARGRLVAYCDADDVVSTGWLAGLVSALSHHEMATGPIDLARLNPYRFYAWRPAPGWSQPLPRWMGYLSPVMGCNMAVRRETFDLVGGFDESCATGGDFDFSWRVQLAGGTVGFDLAAVVHWRLRSGWAYFRRSFEYGTAQVELYRRFRDQGLRRRLLRGAVRLAGIVLGAPLLFVPNYRYGWLTLAGEELGRVKGSLRARTLYL
jgi:glycosyltransferase involved in cell wall biosynthesis